MKTSIVGEVVKASILFGLAIMMSAAVLMVTK